MVLQGAEILFFPTAIGSDPHDDLDVATDDSREHWKRVMQGHAAANLVLFVLIAYCSLSIEKSILRLVSNLNRAMILIIFYNSLMNYPGPPCCF